MVQISLHEARWKLEMIDVAVREGMFRSRAEAYRTGALLLLAMPKFLGAKLSDFDLRAIREPIRNAISSLDAGTVETTTKYLGEVNRLLVIQSCLLAMAGSDQSEEYETEAMNSNRYRDVLIQFDKFDEGMQQIILEDLRRDLQRILEWTRLSEVAKRERETAPFSRMVDFVEALQRTRKGEYIRSFEEDKIIDAYGIMGGK